MLFNGYFDFFGGKCIAGNMSAKKRFPESGRKNQKKLLEGRLVRTTITTLTNLTQRLIDLGSARPEYVSFCGGTMLVALVHSTEQKKNWSMK